MLTLWGKEPEDIPSAVGRKDYPYRSSTGSEAKLLEFKSKPDCLRAVLPGANYFPMSRFPHLSNGGYDSAYPRDVVRTK